MQVTRIYESPRVTRPYSDEQWQEILALGKQVDRDLVAGDVCLTMGGEPTYVATRDRDAAEWNTDALGPTKRNYATELLDACAINTAAAASSIWARVPVPGRATAALLGAVALLACRRRAVWHDQTRFADERDLARYTAEDAQRFTEALAQARAGNRLHHPGLRGQLVLPVARTQAAGQRRPVRLQARRRARACACAASSARA